MVAWHKTLAILALTIMAACCGCAQPNEYKPPPPPEVTVAKPIRQDVTIYLEETGNSEAKERVEIRARVRGYLAEIKFKDGEDVKAGDQLYLIQPAEFKAKVDAAKAEVDLANVALTRTEIEYGRQKNLLKDNATAQSKVEQAEAERDGASASLDAAKASLAQAELDLQYTKVETPISGRVERTQIKLGNLVGDADATHLTTVLSYDPIHVYFNINERALLAALKKTSREDANKRSDITTIKAYLRRATDTGYPFEGNLDYADLGVDQSTGTFKIRAVFPNPQLKIFPGLFVRIRVPLGVKEDALLVPERCVAADQAGRFVIILGDDDTAERRNVTVGVKFGEMVVIDEGLTGDETVVIDGIQRARPGNKVNPKETQLEPVKGDLVKTEGGAQPIEKPDDAATENSNSPDEAEAPTTGAPPG